MRFIGKICRREGETVIKKGNIISNYYEWLQKQVIMMVSTTKKETKKRIEEAKKQKISHTLKCLLSIKPYFVVVVLFDRKKPQFSIAIFFLTK